MVLHIDGDRGGGSIISIPRDSWVTVPGYGQAKINVAFSYAGPSLTADTLGGVEVNIPETTYDSMRKKKWTAGRHKLDGAETLTYVRQRYGLPGGDFDRIKRQQNVMRTLMGKRPCPVAR